MIALLCFFLTLFASLFKSKSRLEAENAALRHQLIVLQRKVHGRIHFTNRDRLFFAQLGRRTRRTELLQPEDPLCYLLSQLRRFDTLATFSMLSAVSIF